MLPSNKILVAPLNWGLGHATRCIPVIKELQRQGAEVLLASDGRALDLLKKEFPELPVFSLPGYGISYQSKNIIRNVGRSAFAMLLAVAWEKRIVDRLVKEHSISGVISDNRLGCYSRKVPSVFITHQINLLVPSALLQWVCRHLNYHYIRKYSHCWVPDVEGEPNLSGLLSHNTPIGFATFLGAVSRMENFSTETKYDVVAVLSGPEPQRTILEAAILEQAQALPYRFLIVQGITERSQNSNPAPNIDLISSLTSRALNEAVLASRLFLGRTGYSSVMDLAKLGKPALLVPTPGQTEQEYLGRLFSENNLFEIQSQENLDLKTGIPNAFEKQGINGHFFDDEKFRHTVKGFLEKCRGA